jgi:DNA-directed RNA polymerase beta' subunit
MSVELIVNRLRETFPYFFIVYTPENAPEIIFRIYIRRIMIKTATQIEINSIRNIANGIFDTIIRGVDGIRSASVTKLIRNHIGADGSIMRADNRYGISTLGTNMMGVLSIKGISRTNTMSDSIMEISDMLGIEAVRTRLFTEIKGLQDTNINGRHLSIYADEMTYTGKVTSIARSGLSTRESSNVMLRIGFASPIQMLEEAGINAMEDNIQGITAPILIGTTPRLGTNYNTFHVNVDVIRDNMQSADDALDQL